MFKRIVALAAIAAIGGTSTALAIQTWNGSTYQAQTPTRLLNTVYGGAKVSKVSGSPVNRYDVRLIRNNVQKSFTTFTAGSAGVTYTLTTTAACNVLQGGSWQTQVRPVTASGAAGQWSTSTVASIAC